MLITDWKNIGRTVEEREICSALIGAGYKNIIIMACMHGDEAQGKFILLKLLSYYEDNIPDLTDKKLIFIPVVNPDGFVKKSRCNANRVDINRNFPTENWQLSKEIDEFYSGPSPASEPETIALIDIIDKYLPKLIITLHQPYKVINFDGPAKEYAEIISRYNKYNIVEDIGYSTPGSFGTYAGIERKIPTVTLELPENEPDEKVWKDNSLALISVINKI